MYSIEYTNRFRKDLVRCQKQGKDIKLIHSVISQLAAEGSLPAKYRPHKLVGRYVGKWECHIQPDWLLVWEQYNDQLRMLMTNTGSHSEIF